MTILPFTGGGGLAGWSLLSRTGDRQRQMVAQEGQIRQASQHYRDRIASVGSADDLLSDYKLLKLSLGAFGLEADVGNKAFIRKILESDLDDDKSLANRLADKSYRKLAEAFGFGAGKQRPQEKGFADRIVSQFVEREFEARVGESDGNLRLALSARRELAELSATPSSNDTKWFEILGNTRLRKVFEGAFGFSSSYAKMPIDRQHAEFKAAARRVMGTDSVAAFSDKAQVEKLVRTFLARSAVRLDSASNRYSTALTLLSSSRLR